MWPFARWGLDIIGPFPAARGNLRFAFVAIEYFSRWVEAEPVAKITAVAAQRFVWKNIVCRYGVPRDIVTDNGTQFDSEAGHSVEAWEPPYASHQWDTPSPTGRSRGPMAIYWQASTSAL